FGTFMTSFVKVYAHHHGLITYKNALKLPGILERAERSILLIIALGFYIFSNSYIQTKYILIIIAFLSLLTFIQRFYLILKK
ncbi:MAG: CDP-alcohol phosphatidyltransferase family protein, partial [Candidatus Aenigmatarchaeota archaeon]